MLALAASFALGIVLSGSQQASLAGVVRNVPWLLAGSGLCMAAGLLFTRWNHRALAALCAAGGFILAGAVAANLFEFRFAPRDIVHLEDMGIRAADPVEIAGRIATSPTNVGSGLQFDLAVDEIDQQGNVRPAEGTVRLWMHRARYPSQADLADSLNLGLGESIRVRAELRRPQIYRDPGVFIYRRWLESVQDIAWQGTVKGLQSIEKLQRPRGWPADVIINRVRHRLLDGIDRIYPPWSLRGRDGAVLKAVLLGDRSSLDSETLENFRQSGLYHLLVISGLHVGLLVMLALYFLRLLPMKEIWRTTAVLIFLFGYCSLVDLRAPTIRAAIMITVYLVARYFYRDHAELNAVGLAGLILLVARPPWLFESGFQLSFSAALLIVAIVVPILRVTTEPYRQALQSIENTDFDVKLEPRLTQLRLDLRRFVAEICKQAGVHEHHRTTIAWCVSLPIRVAVWTLNIIIFSAILQIGLTLPMAETFHRVTFIGIGLNAVAIPLMTILLGLAVPTVLLGSFAPSVAAWPARLLALVMDALFKLTSLQGLPHWLSYRVATPPAWVAWGFVICVVAAAMTLAFHRRVFLAAALGSAVFAALIAANPFAPRIPTGHLEVTLLVLPDRSTTLFGACSGGSGIDFSDPFTPRRWDPGEQIVSPYLWSRGVKKIDFLILDERGDGQLPGIAAITRNFSIGEVLYPGLGMRPRTLGFIDDLARQGIHTRSVPANRQVSLGGTEFQICSSLDEDSGAVSQDNDLKRQAPSIGLRTSWANVLFGGGDIPGDEDLHRNNFSLLDEDVVIVEEPNLRENNLKALEKLRPQAIVAEGESGELVRLSTSNVRSSTDLAGTRLYHTSLDGAVTLDADPSAISIHTYQMPAGEDRFTSGATRTGDSSSSSVR